MKIKKSKKTNANKVIPLLLVVSMINTMFLPITATAKTIEDVKPVVVGSVPMGYVGGSIDTVEDTSHLNFANSKTRARASLPQSYNMMNEGKITTRIEDQARTSNCWAFSSLGSVESSIFSQLNDIDLSERHLAYFATVGKNNLLDPADGTNGDIFTPSLGSSWQNCGGNYQITTATLTRGVGPLLESKAPYNDPLTEPDAKLEFAKPDVFIKDGFRLPNKDVNGTLDGTHIKQTLMNNSSVMVSYGALMSQFYDAQVTYPTYYSSYTQDDFPSGDIGGHAVQIIGWDDTISKDKFTDFQRQTSKPSVDGAWIIKNSWGENSLGSIFYMSYDTKCMSSFYAYKATDDKNLMYDNNYQYDGVGALRTFNLPGVNTEYMANVFTAKGNETLESVSINTASHNQPYTISIYKGMQDTTNPTSGTKVHEQSGTATYSGYHNIKLNNSNAINFAADEKFIVVVKFVESDNADLGTMCFEYEYSNFSEATMKAGESFISSDGIYWGDAKDNAVQSNIPIGNICIKAFTDNIKPNTFSNWTDIANSAQKDTDYTENKNSLTIKTATGLAWFAKSVNDGNGYQGKTVSLENNVDLDTGLVVGYDKAVTEDNSWIPIGKDSSPFKGIFDGKGFEISGIKINNNLNRQGLFGNILGDASIKASISNLGIVSADIIGGEFTGSIVGSGFNVIMYDCYNKSTTTKSSSVTGKSLVGGLAGELQDSTMQNCYNTGKVMLSTEDGVAGGLIGRITKESIINCFNAGEITTTESTSATNIQKGGIIGQIINATAKNCYYLNTTENSFADSNEGIITATKMTVEEMQDTTFVDTLNKNLDEFDNTGLHLWKAVSRDYPTLDFENYWKITLLPENFKFTEPTNLYFNNDPKIAGVEFNDSIIGAGTVTVNYYKGSTKLASEPTDVGTYTVKVDVTKGIHYEAVTDLEVGTFTISYIKSPSLSMFTFNESSTKDVWYNEDLVIEAPIGYTVSESILGTYDNSLTVSADKKADYKVYLKDTKGNITDAIIIGEIKLDKVAPISEINIKENSFKTFMKNITFGLFFKDNIDVTITAADTLSGVRSMEYQQVSNEEDYKEDGTWTEYKDTLNIIGEGQYIIYAKVTDNAGNKIIINSNGVVVYADSTVSATVTDFDKKDGNQVDIDVTMILKGNTLKEIKNGDEVLVKDTDYSVNGNKVTIKKEYLAKFARGTETLSFNFYPRGFQHDVPLTSELKLNIKDTTHIHVYDEEFTIDIPATCTAEGEKSKHCKDFEICGGKTEVTSIPALGHDYGDWVKDGDNHKRVCKHDSSHIEIEAHIWGPYISNNDATCTAEGTKTATCTKCTATKTVIDTGSMLKHDFDTSTYITDATHHWHKCKNCEEISVKTAHSGGRANCHAKAICSECNTEYGEFDLNNHDGETELRDVVAATHSTEGYSGDTYCLGCNTKIAEGNVIEKIPHTWATEWTHDETNHWHVCTDCNEINDKEAHIWDNGTITKQPTYTTEGVKTFTCKCLATKTEVVEKLIDLIEPNGEIKIATNSFKEFINTITFGLFFKENQRVTITAEDAGIGLDKVYYYLSDKAMTLDEVKALTADKWIDGDTVNLKAEFKGVVYAKITDKSANTCYISSNGMIFDGTAAVISGVKDGEEYCETATVTIIENYIDSVTLDGEKVTLDSNNKLILLTKDKPQTIMVTDKAGNVTTVTVTVNAEHKWDEGRITTEPTIKKDGIKTFTCTVCGEIKTEAVTKLPVIIEGKDIKFTKGSKEGLTFRSDAILADFLSVTVDGKEVPENCFEKSHSSTIITLTSAFLDTLSVGEHTLAINSKNGTAQTTFTVEEKPADPIKEKPEDPIEEKPVDPIKKKPTNPETPKTGDNGNIPFYLALILISGGAVTMLGINKKRRKANDK